MSVDPNEAPSSSKVSVLLNPVGDAPILKKRKYAVDPSRDIAWFTMTIRRMLNLPPEKSLFFFVAQSFAPSPDHTFEVLRNCFSLQDDTLVLHYSTTLAWG